MAKLEYWSWLICSDDLLCSTCRLFVGGRRDDVVSYHRILLYPEKAALDTTYCTRYEVLIKEYVGTVVLIHVYKLPVAKMKGRK